ncbi:hypothetical protein ACS0TY_033988 [Phlomoides rotata]
MSSSCGGGCERGRTPPSPPKDTPVPVLEAPYQSQPNTPRFADGAGTSTAGAITSTTGADIYTSGTLGPVRDLTRDSKYRSYMYVSCLKIKLHAN